MMILVSTRISRDNLLVLQAIYGITRLFASTTLHCITG